MSGRVITTIAGKNIITLGQFTGKRTAFLSPLSGNLRYANTPTGDKDEIDIWVERTADESLDVVSYVERVDTPAFIEEHYTLAAPDIAKLRKNDEVDVLNSSDEYLNTIKITKIDRVGNKITFIVNDTNNTTITHADTNKIRIPEDPYLIESFSTELPTKKIDYYYLCVFGANRLNIETGPIKK